MNLALKNTPESIQTLAQEIRHKSGDEAEAAIVKLFGPGRDVGSGLRILQWDVGTGTLTFSGGLARFQMRTGPVLWLTETSNKALPVLTQSEFEMTTPPSPHMKYWLGGWRALSAAGFSLVEMRNRFDLPPE